jgi:putative ABC transport system permease protein
MLAIPLMVAWTGRLAKWLPMSARLAARHTARHGRRTGAALAAATLALALPVAVSTMTLSAESYDNRALPLADDQAVVGVFGTAGTNATLVARVGNAIRARFPDATVATLEWATFSTARYPSVSSHTQVFVGVGLRTTPDGTKYQESGYLAIVSTALLRTLHAEPGIERIGDAPILAIGTGSTDGGFVQLEDPSADNPDATRRVPAEEIESPRSLFTVLPVFLRRLGFVPSVGGLVVRFADAPDGSSIAALRDIAAGHPGMSALTNADYRSNAAPIRRLLTLGSTLIAILVLSVAVALVSSESRRDHAILVAVGAEPRIRRRVVGANALLLAALAGLLAVPAGFVPAAVIQLARAAPYPVVLPWESWLVVGIASPLLTGGLAALCSRPPKPSALLQPAF